MAVITATAVAIGIVISAIVILGILYLTIQIQKKISARRLKQVIQTEQRLNGAVRATIHSKEGNSVKANVLDAKGETFSELTVTGKSTSRFLREGQTLKVK